MERRTLLADRYSLISPLGRGGMGQVWEGRDEILGRAVAVKLVTEEILAGRTDPKDAVRRFTREAAVTAGLAHPGVPAIYDAGEYDGGLFLVMELIEGCTIGDAIAEHGPLPVPWVAAIGAQVAAILVVAHERGIVHRDIKPQNVMLTWTGTAKILDFGVAGLADQPITSSGVAVGTPAYMAPEQLHSLPPTPRTDLYALGCLLYEMLSGEPVFAGSSAAALMRKHLDEAPAPLLRADLDYGLAALVLQSLEKDPARRPADAREVYDRLLPFAGPLAPLGDINPATADGKALRLYSELQVRAGGADGNAPTMAPIPYYAPALSPYPYGPAFSPYPYAPAPGPTTRPSARRRALWNVVHSLWLLPTLLFGLGTWLSFGYIGLRHKRLRWVLFGVAYLLLLVTAFVLIGSGPDNNATSFAQGLGGVLWICFWLGGIIHALWVNVSVRLRLRSELGS